MHKLFSFQKSLILTVGFGVIHHLSQKTLSQPNYSEIADSQTIKEGTITQIEIPSRGQFYLTQINGEVHAVQKAIYNEKGHFVSDNLANDIIIGDRIFNLDTLDGYSIKDGLPDQFTDQLGQRFLHPYSVQINDGLVYLSQTPDLSIADEILTGWVGKGNQVLKVIAIVGNTKQAFDCIRTLRACKYTGKIVYIPSGGEVNQFKMNIDPVKQESEQEFLARYKVIKVPGKIQSINPVKMYITFFGAQALHYNQLLLTDYGQTQNIQVPDYTNLASFTIDFLTPSSLAFALSIQQNQRLQGKSESKIFFQYCKQYTQKIQDYLLQQVQKSPNLAMGDGGAKIMIPTVGDEILTLEKEYGDELLDSSIQGMSEYDYTYISSKYEKRLFPYQVNSGQIIGFNMLFKRVAQQCVKYETNKHHDNILYQVGVCDKSSMILTDEEKNWMQICFKNNQLIGAIGLNRGRDMIILKELLQQDMLPVFNKHYNAKEYLNQMSKKLEEKKKSQKLMSSTLKNVQQGPIFFYR